MVRITPIFSRVLRWLLRSDCAACDKRTTDLAPACIHCSSPLPTEIVDIVPKVGAGFGPS
jgi:hypothetical protein